jgi:hypothetical protein
MDYHPHEREAHDKDDEQLNQDDQSMAVAVVHHYQNLPSDWQNDEMKID